MQYDDASTTDIMRHILDSLGDIEEKLDEQGIPVNEVVAKKLDAARQVVKKLAVTNDKENSANEVFEKLAQVADSLDREGASGEASMIDGFLAKYGADYPGHPDAPDDEAPDKIGRASCRERV